MITESLPKRIIKTPVLVETEQFLVKLAENQEEVEKTLRLRYEVFNIEQGRGLKTAEEHSIDSDEFDHYCLHLFVLEKWSGRVIGTYRIHLGMVAKSAKGFYSSREYEIKGLYKIADKCMELGRSCVTPEFRTGSVIALLWKAITELLVRTELTFMLGCVSLEEEDPVTGWALYEYFHRANLLSEHITAIPHPEFELERPPDHEIEKFLSDERALKKCIPPLFKGYLRLGGLVCGQPALDSEFGTIDFFIMVDTTRIPERYVRHFNYIRNIG
ncbi:MAG: GNAT family N-acyltransferase [Candidatus Omnitrophota bacterium]